MNQLPTSDRKKAIGMSADGKGFDYPSARNSGHDSIDYQRRSPSVAGQAATLSTFTIKVRDLPYALVTDLAEAHRSGNLRAELTRHLSFLESAGVCDVGTTKLLRAHEKELTGHHTRDGEVLERVNSVLRTLRPESREP